MVLVRCVTLAKIVENYNVRNIVVTGSQRANVLTRMGALMAPRIPIMHIKKPFKHSSPLEMSFLLVDNVPSDKLFPALTARWNTRLHTTVLAFAGPTVSNPWRDHADVLIMQQPELSHYGSLVFSKHPLILGVPALSRQIHPYAYRLPPLW